ncbi:hypothetical protein BMS3Abin01_00081 [bacterium BMS3Abin01]|nr:hypothetical protein BMS3Abin01_00081 [bacterium BMS3Abin01]
MIIFAGLALSITAFATIFWLERSRGAQDVAAGYQAYEGGALLFAGVDPDGALNQVLVLVSEDEGGFSIYTIPARTIAATESAGFQRLDTVMADSGPGSLADTVAGLLQIPIGRYAVFNDQTLEKAAGKAETINFQADQPLETAGGEVSLTAGDNLVAPDTALSWLKASATDAQAGPTIQALFFQGLSQALASLPADEMDPLAAELAGTMDSNLGPGELAALIASVVGSGRQPGVWPLPVRYVGGEDWYFEPVPDQVAALVQGSSAGALFDLQIRNGTETTGLVEAAAAKLAPLRYNIAQDPAPSEVNYDHTQIRCGSEALAECRVVHDTLEAGTIIKDESLDKQRIIVIIGRDMVPAGEQ